VVVIALDPAQFSGSISEIISELPLFLQTVQTVFYIFLVLFFGSIAVTGFRVYAPFWKRFLLRLVFGLLALFSGIAIRGLIPLPGLIFIKLMQLDIILGGIIASVVFAISLLLISRTVSAEDTLKRAIDGLYDKLKKEQSRHKPDNALKSPHFIAGVLIIVAMLLFSAANFTGLPSMQENVLSTFGISPEDWGEISKLASSMQSEGCSEVTGVLLRHKDDLQDILTGSYENPSLESLMSNEAGEEVLALQRGEAEGVVFVLGVTASGTTCVGTENRVCFCQKA